jgi:hypothetical protein
VRVDPDRVDAAGEQRVEFGREGGPALVGAPQLVEGEGGQVAQVEDERLA